MRSKLLLATIMLAGFMSKALADDYIDPDWELCRQPSDSSSCLTIEAALKPADGQTVDTTTHWTPEDLTRSVAEDAVKVSYVHWMVADTGENKLAIDALNGYLAEVPIDQVIVINLSSYDKADWEPLLDTVLAYNKVSRPIRQAPTGSLFANRQEARINGIPKDQAGYRALIEGMKNFIGKNSK